MNTLFVFIKKFYQRKLNISLFHFLFFLFFFVVCSCNNQSESSSYIEIMDKEGILTQLEIDTLSKLDIKGANIIIYTVDSLMVDEIEKAIPSIWDSIYFEKGLYEDGAILVLGSRTPNCAYIFCNDDNTYLPVITNGYASKEYFETQLNDSINTDRKIIEMIYYAMNSYMAKDNTINIIESEIVGFFYKFTIPSNRWYYSKILKSFQRCYLSVEKYLGYWLSVFLICFVLFYIKKLVSNYYTVRLLSCFKNDLFTKTYIYAVLLKVLPLMIYLIPVALSIISVLNARSFCGMEFASNVAAIEGISVNEVYDYYVSSFSSNSSFLALTAATMYIISIWDEMYIYRENIALFAIFGPIIFLSCCSMSSSVNWVVIVMSLLNIPDALKKVIEIDGFSQMQYKGLNYGITELRKEVSRNHLIFLFHLLLGCFIYIIIYSLMDTPTFTLPHIQ